MRTNSAATTRWSLLLVALAALAGCDRTSQPPAAPAPAAPPRLWTYKADGAVTGGVAVGGRTAYFGDAKGTLHAVNLANGLRRWTYKATDAISTTPLVHEGRVLVGDEGGMFHCVSAADGRKLWTFKTDDGPIHSSANAEADRVLFGSDDNFLYCLNLADGGLLWKLETDNYVYCRPEIDGGHVFIAGCDGELKVIDLAGGKVVRAAELKFHAAAAPLVLAAEVIAVTMDGHVQCFDRETLAERWTTRLEEAEFYASPSLAEGLLIIGSRGDRRVYALDVVDGEKKWDFLTRGSVDCPPAIAGEHVYVGSGDGKLYALRLATGQRLWQYVAGRGIGDGIAVVAGVLVFGDGGGTVHCLGHRP